MKDEDWSPKEPLGIAWTPFLQIGDPVDPSVWEVRGWLESPGRELEDT